MIAVGASVHTRDQDVNASGLWTFFEKWKIALACK
jgi:hypothetical protein